MAQHTQTQQSPQHPARHGFLARMRIRKKLVVLHTVFSVLMTLILLVALRPALLRVVARAEQDQAVNAMMLAYATMEPVRATEEPKTIQVGQVTIHKGIDPRSVDPESVAKARETPGTPVPVKGRSAPGLALLWHQDDPAGQLWLVESSLRDVRREVIWVYGYTIAALLIVYALVAVALELFILPTHVYQPLATLLRADRALREGDREAEFVREQDMPADELGEIMRSRNASIRTIRSHESALADALNRIELVATDLKRKNHLLENARRNLADVDRLASLGMMAAGIAHELNTPLAVAKGLAEKLYDDQEHELSQTEAALLRRVIGRIERLSEGLLDFARVRPPMYSHAMLHSIVEDAITLTRLDRGAQGVQVVNNLPPDLSILADEDRLVQVMVNLIRNAMDAMGAANMSGDIVIDAKQVQRDGQDWISITITDDGPGIDHELLERLFDPFVSERLDDRGTGLGLAVCEGIINEHGGTIFAHNRTGARGAVFEVMLPMSKPLQNTSGSGTSQ